MDNGSIVDEFRRGEGDEARVLRAIGKQHIGNKIPAAFSGSSAQERAP